VKRKEGYKTKESKKENKNGNKKKDITVQDHA